MSLYERLCRQQAAVTKPEEPDQLDKLFTLIFSIDARYIELSPTDFYMLTKRVPLGAFNQPINPQFDAKYNRLIYAGRVLYSRKQSQSVRGYVNLSKVSLYDALGEE